MVDKLPPFMTRDDLCDAVVEAQRVFDAAKEDHLNAKRTEIIAAETLRAASEKLEEAYVKLRARLRDESDAGKYAPPNSYAPFLKEISPSTLCKLMDRAWGKPDA